jgi:hypothetical protein
VRVTLVPSGRPLTPGDLGFTQCGENLFDGVTETWHSALLAARPSQTGRIRLRGAGHFRLDLMAHEMLREAKPEEGIKFSGRYFELRDEWECQWYVVVVDRQKQPTRE